MTIALTSDELEIEMAYHREPLRHLREMVHEWRLGIWQLSKFSPTWRIGWAHRLNDKAKWSAFSFPWQGETLIGLLFDSGGDQPPWFMAGWVKAYNASLADYWVEFLNNEISNRLAGKESKHNGRLGLVSDAQGSMYAYEDDVQHRKNVRQFDLTDDPPCRPQGESAAEHSTALEILTPFAQASAKEKAKATAKAAGPIFKDEYRVIVFDRDRRSATGRDYQCLFDACQDADGLARVDRAAFVYGDHFHLLHYAVPRSLIGDETAKLFDHHEIAGRQVAQAAGTIAAGGYRLVILDGESARTRDFSRLKHACSFARGIETLDSSGRWKPVMVFDETFALVDRAYPHEFIV